LLAVGALGAPLVPGRAGPAAGAPAHTAGVIIETGERTWRTVIRFSDEEITGVQALVLAGADPVISTYAGLGAAVCALHGVGRPAGPNCLGGADGDPRYWAYFRAPAGTGRFEYSRTGAGATRVRNGDVEGWRWGTGQAPTFVSLDRIGAPAPTTTTRPPATTRPSAPTRPPASPAPPAGPAAPSRSPQGPQLPDGAASGVSPAGDLDVRSGDAGGAPDAGSVRPDARDRRTGRPGTAGDRAESGGAAAGRIGGGRGGGGREGGGTDGRGPPVAGYAAFAGLLAAIGAGIVTARRRRVAAERPVP
jgi:hypothetical protein